MEYLHDSDHPLFLHSIKYLKNEADKKGVLGAVGYLNMILKAYNTNNLDFVYALALPIKDYKKK